MNTRGTARSFQSLTGALSQYRVFCACPEAVSDPESASGVNLQVTGSLEDLSQKNFEILVQSISLRATPVILTEPRAVSDLAALGAEHLTGEGFVWSFTTELEEAFGPQSDPTLLLRSEINGIVLPSGVVLDTNTNIEFVYEDPTHVD